MIQDVTLFYFKINLSLISDLFLIQGFIFILVSGCQVSCFTFLITVTLFIVLKEKILKKCVTITRNFDCVFTVIQVQFTFGVIGCEQRLHPMKIIWTKFILVIRYNLITF